MKAEVPRHLVALAAVAVALLLRWALNPWLGDRVPFITIFGAVIVAAWYGGFAPALAAALAGWLGAEFFFIEPAGSLTFRGATQLMELIAYLGSTLLIAALGGAMHRARAQAGDSQRQFRAFIENSPVAVFIKDDALRYVFANRAAERALGTGDWKGRSDLDLLPAQAAEQIRAHDRSVLERGAASAFDIGIQGAGGTRRYHSTKFPLHDAQGRSYLGVVSVDLTGQKRTEEELQFVTDAMAVGVIRCSSDARVLWANRIFCEWLARPLEDLAGRTLEEVFGREAAGEIGPHVERARRGQSSRYERLVNYPGLGPRWVAATYTPTGDGGWVAVVYDIHERRQMEEALKAADRRKDEFLATLGHELRNPLAPIRNAVAILARVGSPVPEAVWSRDLIERQVGQMSRLIDDLLDIARISSGKLALRRQRMRLRLALEMALETARPNLDAAGVRLELGLAAADLDIDADATRLAQVFSNLLNNAAKFTDGGGQVVLEAAREGDEAVVRVADTGIGFPPEIAERLFEPFAQAHAERARAGGGLGIGLALASGIVALHGGSISAHSRGASQGSEFVVRLPLAPAALKAKEARPPEQEAATVRGVRVLVADDNRDAADSLSRILTLYGYDVRVAYDGTAAIAAAEAFRPAAAVLDIGMPGVNGYDVARALRERHGPALRLVALTGWGQAADRQRASDAGFDHHLTKPMDPAVLHELLATVKV